MHTTQNTQTTKRNFKIGDIVRCTSQSYTYIFEWAQYVVSEVEEGYHGTNIRLTDWSGLMLDCWYPSEDFELIEQKKEEKSTEFDILNTPWFIRVKDEEEFEIAKEFLKSIGFFFSYGVQYEAGTVIANRSATGEVLPFGKQALIRTPFTKGKKEIKLNFKTEKVLDYVQYPKVQYEDPDQAEIQKIEDEMRKLADRLNAIKKN